MKRKILAVLCTVIAVGAMGMAPIGAAPASRPHPDRTQSNRTDEVAFTILKPGTNVRWRLDLAYARGFQVFSELGFARAKNWTTGRTVRFKTDPATYTAIARRAWEGGPGITVNSWVWVLTIEVDGLASQFVYDRARAGTDHFGMLGGFFPYMYDVENQFIWTQSQPYVAVDDFVTIPKNTTTVIDVTANDWYPDTDPFITSTKSVTGIQRYITPADGNALVAKGTVIVTKDRRIKYTPPKDFVGVDTFDYFLGNWSWARIKVNVVA